MSVTLAIGLYFIIWWTILFAVLPLGIRSQAESGEIAHGTEPGAPAAPGLLKKALITSVLAAFILAGVIAAVQLIEL